MMGMLLESKRLDVGDGAEAVVGTISDGKNSPGLNINVAFLAYACWISSVSVALALITPTIPSSIQAPGAEQ